MISITSPKTGAVRFPMFDTVNTKVGEIAGEVGQTPLAWNSGVFSMIRNLSETVIVPIAGVILTWATRSCCASPCSRPAASLRACSERIKEA